MKPIIVASEGEAALALAAFRFERIVGVPLPEFSKHRDRLTPDRVAGLLASVAPLLTLLEHGTPSHDTMAQVVGMLRAASPKSGPTAVQA